VSHKEVIHIKEKKDYTPPQLIVLGTVESLTNGGGFGAINDHAFGGTGNIS